jgi:hypothetical protein
MNVAKFVLIVEKCPLSPANFEWTFEIKFGSTFLSPEYSGGWGSSIAQRVRAVVVSPCRIRIVLLVVLR